MNEKIIEKILLKYLWIEDGGNIEQKKEEHHLVWKYIIVRWYYAWVWAWVLKSKNKEEIVLNDARMLRYRRASEWTGLSGIAESGLREDKKWEIVINKQLKQITITDPKVSTLFETTKEVEEQIRGREVG